MLHRQTHSVCTYSWEWSFFLYFSNQMQYVWHFAKKGKREKRNRWTGMKRERALLLLLLLTRHHSVPKERQRAAAEGTPGWRMDDLQRGRVRYYFKSVSPPPSEVRRTSCRRLFQRMGNLEAGIPAHLRKPLVKTRASTLTYEAWVSIRSKIFEWNWLPTQPTTPQS